MKAKPVSEKSTWSKSLRVLRQPYTIGLISTLLATIIALRPWALDWLTNHQSPNVTKLYLRVTDDAGKPIARASVNFDGDNSQFTTDDLGVVKIDVRQKSEVGARIVAAGYTPLVLSVSLPRLNPNVTVVLTPLTVDKGQPAQPYFEVVRSGPRQSGIGRDFSQWYELRSPSPKSGYVVDLENSEYSLSGDRRCNEWSECQLRKVSDQEIIFLFRMQGHSEWFPPRTALSEGILRVQYKPAPH